MQYDAFISYSHAADEKLAPALQSALLRFAKPWHRRRALNIFRDETNLAASPELWPTIVAALGTADHFLLLASPGAARSKWVQREVAWWLAHRSPQRLLIVLTGGTIVWNEEAGDFDWTQTDALPPQLRQVFASEPLWVDLRWARDDTELNLKHPGFLSAIGDLAAPLHGRPKADLLGEDVRQHKRTIRLAGVAIASLVLLLLAALIAAGLAFSAQREAERQAVLAIFQQGRAEGEAATAQAERTRAEAGEAAANREATAAAVARETAVAQEAIAVNQAATAEAARGTAEAQRVNAERQARISLVRALAAQAPRQHLAGQDERGALLARQAYLLAQDEPGMPRAQIDASLRDTLTAPYFFARLPKPDQTLAIEFSPDNRTLLEAPLGGSLVLRRIDQPDRPPVILSHDRRAIDSWMFGPTGRLLVTSSAASAERPGTLMLWDLRQAAPSPVPLVGSERVIGNPAFSPDNRTIAALTDGGFIGIWDRRRPDSGPVLLAGTGEASTDLVFSPDATLLAMGGADGAIRLWAWRSPERAPVELPVSETALQDVRFLASGEMLATHNSAAIQLFDVRGKDDPIVLASGLAGEIFALAISSDDRWLAVTNGFGGADGAVVGEVAVWDLSAVAAGPQRLSGLAAGAFDLEFSPDSKLLGAAGPLLQVRLWDTRSFETPPVDLLPHPSFTGANSLDISFSLDGKYLATSDLFSETRLWSLIGPGAPSIVGDGSASLSIAVTADGTHLVAGGGNERPRLWDLIRPAAAPLELAANFEQWPYVNQVAISPDGRRIVAGTSAGGAGSGMILLWDLDRSASSPQVRELDPAAVLNVDSVAFSPDGRGVAGASNYDSRGGGPSDPDAPQAGVWLWNNDGFRFMTGSGPYYKTTYDVAFSPDGRFLAGAQIDEDIFVWDLTSPSANPIILTSRPDQGDEVDRKFFGAVSFSSDGRLVAAGRSDGVVTLWSLDEPTAEPMLLSGHDRLVYQLAFQPGGNLLASGGRDGTVRLWNVDEVAADPIVLAIDNKGIGGLAFTPDGRHLAVSGASDQTIRLWTVATNELAHDVCSVVWRDLTPEEWGRFIGDSIPYQPTCPNAPSGESDAANS